MENMPVEKFHGQEWSDGGAGDAHSMKIVGDFSCGTIRIARAHFSHKGLAA